MPDIELGGNIVLSGFGELEGGMLVVVKKMIGNYVRKISERQKGFESITVTMKTVHETEASKKYEVHIKLMLNGKPVVSKETGFNLFVVIDDVMKKIDKEIE